MEFEDYKKSVNIIHTDGKIESKNVTEENKYLLFQEMQNAYDEDSAVLLHDNEQKCLVFWNGCLLFHDNLSEKQEQIIEEILPTTKLWSSFYTVNERMIYPFHGNTPYTLAFPVLPKYNMIYKRQINEADMYLLKTNPYLGKCQDFSDEESYITIFNEIIKNVQEQNHYFISLKESLYVFLEQEYLILLRDLRDLSKKMLYLPEKTNFEQRILLYNYLREFSDINQAYIFKNQNIQKFYIASENTTLISEINLSTDPNPVYSLRKNYEKY